SRRLRREATEERTSGSTLPKATASKSLSRLMNGCRSSGRVSTSSSSVTPTQSIDRKSTRLNSSHGSISYAVFCLKKKKKEHNQEKGTLVTRGVDDERNGLGREHDGATRNATV